MEKKLFCMSCRVGPRHDIQTVCHWCQQPMTNCYLVAVDGDKGTRPRIVAHGDTVEACLAEVLRQAEEIVKNIRVAMCGDPSYVLTRQDCKAANRTFAALRSCLGQDITPEIRDAMKGASLI